MKHLLIFLIFSLSLFANIGHIMALKGHATIKNAKQQESQASMGMALNIGDKITTQSKTRMQVVLKDETIVTIGANSTFIFEDYLYDGSKKSHLSMQSKRGFFRSVTGEIGKLAPERFHVKTSSATIGIRGTDFSVLQTDTIVRYICYKGGISITIDGKVTLLDAGKVFEIKGKAGKFFIPKDFHPKLFDVGDITNFEISTDTPSEEPIDPYPEETDPTNPYPGYLD